MRSWWGVGLAGLLAGCQTTPPMESLPQVQAWLAAGGPAPPPVAQCPHVADVDLWHIARDQADPARAEDRAASRAYFDRLFAEIIIPEPFRRPPPDAPVVLRAIEPPGGMYPNTIWSVVWRETDGSWWYWRQNRDPTHLPSPPPPPPPDASEAEQEAYLAYFSRALTDHERWPPGHGRLAAHQVAAVETALADPCRAWEPDAWPSHPKLRGEPEPEPRPPYPDSTPIHVQIQEMGRPARILWAPEDRESHARTLRWVAYAPEAG